MALNQFITEERAFFLNERRYFSNIGGNPNVVGEKVPVFFKNFDELVILSAELGN